MIPFFPMADKTENGFELAEAKFKLNKDREYTLEVEVRLPEGMTAPERVARVLDIGNYVESKRGRVLQYKVTDSFIVVEAIVQGRSFVVIMLVGIDTLLDKWNGS